MKYIQEEIRSCNECPYSKEAGVFGWTESKDGLTSRAAMEQQHFTCGHVDYHDPIAPSVLNMSWDGTMGVRVVPWGDMNPYCPLPESKLIPRPEAIAFLVDFYIEHLKEKLDKSLEHASEQVPEDDQFFQNFSKNLFKMTRELLLDKTEKSIRPDWDALARLRHLSVLGKYVSNELEKIDPESSSHDIFSSYDDARRDVLLEMKKHLDIIFYREKEVKPDES